MGFILGIALLLLPIAIAIRIWPRSDAADDLELALRLRKIDAVKALLIARRRLLNKQQIGDAERWVAMNDTEEST